MNTVGRVICRITRTLHKSTRVTFSLLLIITIATIYVFVFSSNNNYSILHIQGSIQKDQTPSHDKWIVVTSVLEPTPDIKFLSNITGWKVVVVGDKKTPRNWSSPNCVFLSVSDQESLGLSLHKLLPYGSYARKNLGYLYAMAHGAKVIYETDDDNRPLDQLKSFRLEPTMSGLMYDGEHLFNPYHHFGQSTLWPRGYPLGSVGTAMNNTYRLSNEWRTPTIQQGVVNGDPDMDAIFRLTRKQTTSRLDVKFDPAAPPVIVPEGVFSPFNSQNTLFKYEAFWALLLPTTTTFRMCDIWRGYWAQRLLWEIGGRLAFFPPNAYQQRNAHSYMADAEDERDMYYHTDRLLNFLSAWSCPQDYTLFRCISSLSKDMMMENFWKEADVTLTLAWLDDLLSVGYQAPTRVPLDTGLDHASNDTPFTHYSYENDKISGRPQKAPGHAELNTRRSASLKHGSTVFFAASQQDPPSVYGKGNKNLNQNYRHLDQTFNLCNGATNFMNFTVTKATQSTFFYDILIIIVFNFPLYDNVKYMEMIYRPIFPNMVYCGEEPDEFRRATENLDIELSFVQESIEKGELGHNCFVGAQQMGYNVTGYLVVGDDVLLNLWNFFTFDKDRFWTNADLKPLKAENATAWAWWTKPNGRSAYKKSLSGLTKLQKYERRQTVFCNRYHFLNMMDGQNKTVEPNTGHGQNMINREKSKRGGQNLRAERDKQTKTSQSSMTSTNTQNYHANEAESYKCNPSESVIVNADTFLATLRNNTGGGNYFYHAVSDVYYIPANLAPTVAHFFSYFNSKKLMLELTIPMTILGLSAKDDIQFFSGANLWKKERKTPWKNLNTTEYFLHPIKLSDSNNVHNLCITYMPLLFRNAYIGNKK